MTGWSHERVELLEKLWREGMSASQIASRVGGVTRNAVIGKVHRMGLEGRATTSRKRPARSGVSLPFRPTRVQIPTGAAARNRANAKPPKQAKADAAAVRMQLAAIVAADPCNVLDIQDRMCRWPYGDPKEAGFHFCGRRTDGRSYCDPHAGYAYQPRSWRR